MSMKIIDNSNDTTTFSALEMSSTFRYEGDVLMKVAEDTGFNAYNLSEKRLTSIVTNTTVQIVPSELILHGRGWNG